MRPPLHAEWTKLRTIASTGRLLLASIALTVALGTVIVLAVSLSHEFDCRQIRRPNCRLKA
jgi:ABC-2 type transport system permease protein